ncbi:WbqC-like protein family protein [Flavobacterium resistens]|nr:WbqC-like protein family protein [Flavobacterium resistens]
MQPYLFPYIGYFQLIKSADVFVVYDDVNFIKKGWINRNSILVNGVDFLFKVPLNEISQNKVINQVEVIENSNWKKSLLKTITLAYKNAPFFTKVYPIFENIINQEEKNLSKFIIYSLREICSFLSIETNIIQSSDITKNNELKGQFKIIEICNKLNADSYVNAAGGMALYDKEIFLEHNIALNFIKSRPIVYTQFKNEFVPWLSIIDVMMFNSKEQINDFLNQYDLV